MNAKELVDRYYDAWINRGGDFTDVPLAEDFVFTGPVASFDSAEGYRQMASEAGKLVTRFAVRHQMRRPDQGRKVTAKEPSAPYANPDDCGLIRVVEPSRPLTSARSSWSASRPWYAGDH